MPRDLDASLAWHSRDDQEPGWDGAEIFFVLSRINGEVAHEAEETM